MTYFARANCVSSKNKSITTYVILGEDKQLTEEIIRENQQFKEFMHDYKPKVVYVDYAVYNTEEKLDNSMQPETFENIISTDSTFYSQGELAVEFKNKSKAVAKKKKTSPAVIGVICFGIAAVAALGGIAIGKKLFSNSILPEATETSTLPINEDGMIIPEQMDLDAGAEQITVSIDRSYSAIPMEDIELKGAIVDGVATITLPEFDKTDFFTHVPGYTWGFSSIPDGKQIEYYGGQSYEFRENKKLYRVLVKYGGGSGTKNDPYRIDYYDQLELMADEGARGYFKQTQDIQFPSYASHKSIDTVNELKNDPDSEYFEYDGGGFLIEYIDSPLFGDVSGATIKNVNIKNSSINETIYKDYGAIVCRVFNYSYHKNNEAYETGETLIKHCTVSHSSINLGEIPDDTAEPTTTAPIIVPAEKIEYDENGNPIDKEEEKEEKKEVIVKKSEGYSVGAISGNGGQIEDCYVTDVSVNVYSDDYILNVGGISGKSANSINCVVSGFSCSGKIFNAGGIVGSASGSRMYDAKGRELPNYYGGNIQGCVSRNTSLSCELCAGGIAAVGGSNGESPIISNCYSCEFYPICGEYTKDQLTKEGIVGGILGMDGTFENGHNITNTVSVAEYSVIGKAQKSKYDDTVRQAPDYAYYQQNILTVINKNTVSPVNPKEIFTGSFAFGSAETFGSDSGALSYPTAIEDLFEKTITEDTSNEQS